MILRIKTKQNEVIAEDVMENFFSGFAEDGTEMICNSIKGTLDLDITVNGERMNSIGIELNVGWSLKDQDDVCELIFDEDNTEEVE